MTKVTSNKNLTKKPVLEYYEYEYRVLWPQPWFRCQEGEQEGADRAEGQEGYHPAHQYDFVFKLTYI